MACINILKWNEILLVQLRRQVVSKAGADQTMFDIYLQKVSHQIVT